MSRRESKVVASVKKKKICSLGENMMSVHCVGVYRHRFHRGLQ